MLDRLDFALAPPSFWFLAFLVTLVFAYIGGVLAYSRRRNILGWALAAGCLPLIVVPLFFLPVVKQRIHSRHIVIPKKTEHVVVLVHGIRTNAHWFEMVADRINKQLGLTVYPIRYQFFDVISFLLPFTRRSPIDRIANELTYIERTHPNANISVIAHSFGTHAFMKALDRIDLDLRHVILCGSVLDTNFRRATNDNLASPVSIVNECGSKDYLPVLAKASTWGYGPAGTWGLGTTGIRDRFHNLAHSGYFTSGFVDEYWIPFLKDGTVRKTDWETERPPTPYWLSLLGLAPIKWLWFVPILLGVFYVSNLLGYNPVKGAPLISATIGHQIGAPDVIAGLVFENFNREPGTITVAGASLTAPDGKQIPLTVDGWYSSPSFLPEHFQKTSPSFIINGKNVLRIWVRFSSMDQKWQELVSRVNQTCSTITLPHLPDLNTKRVPAELANEAKAAASSYFPWKAGEWKLHLIFNTSIDSYGADKTFDLSAADVANLRRNIDYFETGVGLCFSWRMTNFPGAYPAIPVSLKDPQQR